MATRYIHKVRITNPDNEDMWANIKVHDTIAFVGPNGQEMLLDFRQRHVSAKIIDETGDGNARDVPEPSRLSHMKRITGTDPTQFFDVEVLDGISFRGPNGRRGVIRMPGDEAGNAVDDTASIGISDSGRTRRVHTVKVEDVDDTEKYAGVCVTDAVAFVGENGQQSVLYLPGGDEHDTTEYVGTDDDGDPEPPENSDANIYLFWPDSTDGPWVENGEDNLGITQGILWNIEKLHAGGHLMLVLQFRQTVVSDRTGTNPPPDFEITLPDIGPAGFGNLDNNPFNLMGIHNTDLPFYMTLDQSLTSEYTQGPPVHVTTDTYNYSVHDTIPPITGNAGGQVTFTVKSNGVEYWDDDSIPSEHGDGGQAEFLAYQTRPGSGWDTAEINDLVSHNEFDEDAPVMFTDVYHDVLILDLTQLAIEFFEAPEDMTSFRVTYHTPNPPPDVEGETVSYDWTHICGLYVGDFDSFPVDAENNPMTGSTHWPTAKDEKTLTSSDNHNVTFTVDIVERTVTAALS